MGARRPWAGEGLVREETEEKMSRGMGDVGKRRGGIERRKGQKRESESEMDYRMVMEDIINEYHSSC
eukprot:746707-Hanusia_phi.AAC.1